MKSLKELRQQRALKASRGKAALQELQAIETKGENATAEELAAAEKLEIELEAIAADVPTLDAEIARMEKAQLRAVIFAPRDSALGAGRVFEPNPELTGGFKSMAHFAQAVMGAIVGQPLQLDAAASGYMTNQGSAGEGYLVPPEFSTTVWDMALESTDLLGMCNPEPTQSNAVFKPKDETTPWGSSGVQAAWRGEGAAMTTSKLAMTGELMTLHELYAFCAASSELLADAPMLQDRLTRQAGRAIQWTAAEAVMWGTGAGQPTGFMKSPALVTVAKDAGQADGTLSLTNLTNMLTHVLRAGGRPIWIANQDIISQLSNLTLGNQPAWLPNNQPLQSNPFDGYLLGYPVLFTEHAQTLGTAGDIVCANLAGYYAAVKTGGIDFASSMHLYFDQNLTAFRWTFRMAGQPYLSKVVQPAKGATTKSHFVALHGRP